MPLDKPPGGSGLAAAKNLSTTLQKALHGSGKLTSLHILQDAQSAGWARNPASVAPLPSSSLDCTDDDQARATDDTSANNNPFVGLAQLYPLQVNAENTVAQARVDPLALLLWSWKLCTNDAQHINGFLSSLKRYVGCGEEEAVQIALNIDTVVSGFQSHALAWNVLNGVGPLQEDAIVEAVKDVVCDRGIWPEKIEAVWRCALVHLNK